MDGTDSRINPACCEVGGHWCWDHCVPSSLYPFFLLSGPIVQRLPGSSAKESPGQGSSAGRRHSLATCSATFMLLARPPTSPKQPNPCSFSSFQQKELESSQNWRSSCRWNLGVLGYQSMFHSENFNIVQSVFDFNIDVLLSDII